jgi:hypothetical protein
MKSKNLSFSILILFFFSYVGYTQTWTKPFIEEKVGQEKIFNDFEGFIYIAGFDWDSCQGGFACSTGITVYKIQKIDPAKNAMKNAKLLI